MKTETRLTRTVKVRLVLDEPRIGRFSYRDKDVALVSVWATFNAETGDPPWSVEGLAYALRKDGSVGKSERRCDLAWPGDRWGRTPPPDDVVSALCDAYERAVATAPPMVPVVAVSR